MHREPRIVQGLSFITTLNTAALLHTRPASAETFHNSCGAQGSNKRLHYISMLKTVIDKWKTAKL
jgi:hypothetical protein